MSEARVWILVDGLFREGAEIPLTDRGFRYGMSVFETLAVRDGRILFLAEHLRALETACKAAGLKTRGAEALAGLKNLPDGLLRLYVTAGDGPPTAPPSNERTFALFEAAEFPEENQISQGIRVMVSETPVTPLFHGWKTGNYWQNVRALSAARENGFDEALILNIQGVVFSAAMANVFFVIGGVLQTPALAAGARCGVVREWVREMAVVKETQPSLKDLREAEECFLTNSRLGVMPVAEIDRRRLPSRKAGQALAALYRERRLRV